MKIIYDHQIFSIRQYGGISRYFVELASEISKDPEIEVRVVAPFNRSLFLSEQRGRVSAIGIDLSSIPDLSPRVVRPINSVLFRAYAAFAAPDVVHESSYAPSRTAPKRTRIVTTIHDTIPERIPQFFPGVERLKAQKRMALRRADHVICVSESTRKDLLELYDVDPARVSVALLGSSIESVSNRPAEIVVPYFLHVGGRYQYKNFNGLLAAFGAARLYATHKLVSFTEHPLTASELNVMDKAGVPRASVIRTGGDDQTLARYYAGAEALVFPSFYEGFGIPLLEAMRCGCPIVTSNTSSLTEVAGDAAAYCHPADVKSIADAMLQVASHPSFRSALIARGRARAEDFSWAQCATETVKAYKNALSRA
jgi:glycosyltransferase involved in cell wall biosynthesis